MRLNEPFADVKTSNPEWQRKIGEALGMLSKSELNQIMAEIEDLLGQDNETADGNRMV